jgi:hypothetical protein
MEVTVDLGYEQFLAAVKRLPAGKIIQLKSLLTDDFVNYKASEELPDFQSFLLRAPVMTAKQFDQHKTNRKCFEVLRSK